MRNSIRAEKRLNGRRLTRFSMIVMVLFLLGEFPEGHAETPICGSVSTNSVWSPEGSPYVVTCQVVIAKDVTLTIQAGVEVRVKRRLSLKVDGALVAHGTETAPILFTSNADPPYPGDWGGISFSEGSLPARYDEGGHYVGGSILRFAILQFGGSSGRTGVVEIRGPGPHLENVIIQKNAASAVHVKNGTVRIRNSLLAQNSNSQAFGGGILAFSSTVLIDNSAINKNSTSGSGGGIHAADSSVLISKTTLQENETAGNGGAFFATNSTVTVDQSVFSDNRAPTRGGAIYAARSRVSIAQSMFQDNRTSRTALQGSPSREGGFLAMGTGIFVIDSTLAVRRSAFLRNKTDADCAAMAVVDSSLVLAGNGFFENQSDGNGAALCLEGLADGSSVTYNTIARNQSLKTVLPNIIYLQSGRFPAFTQNNISDNIGLDLLNNTPAAIRADSNWWGTLNERAISGRIYDRTQDHSKGDVLVAPILTAPATLPSASALP